MADVSKLQTLDGILDYPSAEDSSKGTTEQQFQEYLKNHQSVMSDMVAVTLWQPSATYVVGQVVFSPNMPANTCARVATAGTTGSAEPAWSSAGSTISDGTAAYTMMYRTVDFATQEQAVAGTDNKTIVTPAMLKAALDKWIVNTYPPVGTVMTFADDTDPNEIWPNTDWEKFGEGRVLIGAGTYTENGTTYTYKSGDTGGEAKHQLTTDEMPSHNHSASSSTPSLNGCFSTVRQGKKAGPVPYGNGIISSNGNFSACVGGGDNDDWGTTYNINASHSHSVNIASTGGNSRHENRQPYITVNRWKRVS